MKVMAVDYGDSRTGVALSDPTGSIAGEALVVKGYTPEKVLEALLEIISEKKPARIVIGYPKNMNGSIGPRADKSEELARMLRERQSLEVVLWDERLTTVDAHRILSENGRHGKRRKETVDAVAASLILENYLSSLRR